MSNREKRALPDDAERLFCQMVRLVQKEDAEYQDWHDLSPEFLDYLGFPTAEGVEKATLQIRLYAHQDGWCHPAMYVEDGRLFCCADVVESWNDYRRGIGSTLDS